MTQLKILNLPECPVEFESSRRCFCEGMKGGAKEIEGSLRGHIFSTQCLY